MNRLALKFIAAAVQSQLRGEFGQNPCHQGTLTKCSHVKLVKAGLVREVTR